VNIEGDISSGRAVFFMNSVEALEYLKSSLSIGKYSFFGVKGSRGVRMEILSEYIRNHFQI
jgi:hypothetical protein